MAPRNNSSADCPAIYSSCEIDGFGTDGIKSARPCAGVVGAGCIRCVEGRCCWPARAYMPALFGGPLLTVAAMVVVAAMGMAVVVSHGAIHASNQNPEMDPKTRVSPLCSHAIFRF